MSTVAKTQLTQLRALVRKIPLLGRIIALLLRLGNLLPHAPITTMMTALMWLLFVVYHGHFARDLFGFGYASRPSHLLTAGLTSPTFSTLIIATFLALIAVAPAEHWVGSRWLIVLLPLCQSGGLVLGMLAAKAVAIGKWQQKIAHEIVLTPTIWMVGVIAFATAFYPLLWRRRVRLVLFVLLTTFLLYSGVLADFARFFAGVIGLVLGQLLSRRKLFTTRMTVRELRNLIAASVFALQLGPWLASLNPDAAGPFSDMSMAVWRPRLPEYLVSELCQSSAADCLEAAKVFSGGSIGAQLENLIILLLMAIICWGLSRGRRAAWWLAFGAVLASAAMMVADMAVLQQIWEIELGQTVLIISIVLPWLVGAVVLLLVRRFFSVKVQRGACWRFLMRVLSAAAVTAVVWVTAALLLREFFLPQATVKAALLSLPMRFLPPVLADAFDSHLLPLTNLAWWFYTWPGALFWLAVAVVTWLLLVSVPLTRDPAQQARAATILQQGSGDHLAWMTLWPGNCYWFHEGGYVAYRVHNSVCVTVGEPVTTGKVAPAKLAAAFETYALSQGWQPVWYSVRSEFATAVASRGFNQVQVAEESVVNCEKVAFTGKKFQDVRTARNRAGKEGIHSRWCSWVELDPHLREGIVNLSEEWVAEKALPEMGFTLGGLDQLKDEGVQLMLALDDDEHVHGVTSWLPVYEEGKLAGYILDFMRRDANGFRPVIEFLIAETIIWANAQQLGWISLSGAPLAHGSEQTSPLSRLLDRTGQMLEPLYGFRSLAAFKRKFHPQTQAWVMCYRDELALPAIGVAVSKCYLPEMSAGTMVDMARIWAGQGS